MDVSKRSHNIGAYANGAVPDLTPHSAAPNQGHHRLGIVQTWIHRKRRE